MASIGYASWKHNVELLKHYIGETGMSYEDIAKKCGMWGNTVSNIVQGLTYGNKSTWENLSKHLGVDFRFGIRKADLPKPVVQKKVTNIKGIPIYVFNCLKEHKNTVVNKELMKRVGSKRFVEILKEQGYDVITEQDQDGDWIVKCV